RALRRAKGMTQDYVARQIGVDRSTYAHWERGSAEPSIEHIKALADVFDISVDYLFERSPSHAGDVIALNRGKLPPNLPPEALRELEEHLEYLEWKYRLGPQQDTEEYRTKRRLFLGAR